jgi:LPS-assembly lipoprotein
MMPMRLLLWFAVLPVLSACGFQMQGAAQQPVALSPIFLDVPDPNSDLAFQLARALAASGVTLARDAEEAAVVLAVSNERYGRRVKSVSAQNRPTEFEVFYEIVYTVRSPSETLVPPQRLARSRIFPYNERDILAKQQEEDLLRDALARDIAGVINRRLAELGSAR